MYKTNKSTNRLVCAIKRIGSIVGVGAAIAVSQAASASCTYSIQSEWNSGFVANVTIKNDTGAPINSWNVSWQYSVNRMSNGWNANYSGSNPYTASNMTWNGSIAVGQSVTFGLQGVKNNSLAAEVPAVTGAACNGGGSSAVSSSSRSSSISSSLRSSSISSSSRSSSISSSSSSSSSSASSTPFGLIFRGVSLAGADFGEGNLPGTYLTDYIYPDQTEVNYFKGKNMSTVRLPFRWERLQRTLGGEFDATELSRLDTFVNAATASGVYVVIDPHNYARYNGNIIGSGTVTNAHFANFWSRLANRYKSNNRIIFALMNEPHTMATEQWLSAANAGIAAIRAAGATNLILVPGNAWTGGHSWNQSWYGTANSIVMQNIVDSGNNYAIEIHQYLDADSSGVSSNCVSASIGVERLTEMTAWLNTHGKRAFLGEFAGGNNATCQAAVQNMLQYMQNNNNVWIGWSWWAAGPWWGDNHYSLEPANGVDKPQMSWLAPYLF